MGKREKVLEKARDCWKKGRAPCPKAWVRAKGGGQGRGGGGQGTAPPQHPKAPPLPPPPRGAPGPAWPCRAWSCAPWPWSSSSSSPSSSSSASWSPSPPKVTPGPLPGLGLDAVRFWGAHGGDVPPGMLLVEGLLVVWVPLPERPWWTPKVLGCPSPPRHSPVEHAAALVSP